MTRRGAEQVAGSSLLATSAQDTAGGRSESRRPWTKVHDGLLVDVRLTPKGGRDAIEGFEQLADLRCVIKVRVRAAPHEGAANGALIKLVAAALDIAPSRVTLLGGATARIKRLKIEGEGAVLAAALNRILDLGNA